MRRIWLVLLVAVAVGSIASCVSSDGLRGGVSAAKTGVTFIATSDCHYDAFENEDRNERDRATIDRMNAIAGVAWPAKLGGDPIDRPRGVVVLGDLIDDGDRQFQGKNQTQPQWAFFVKDFGLDGTDGRLKYPVFETWGNHDGPPVGKERFGFSTQAHLKERNRLRLRKGLVTNLSENGLHYSWDWDRVHLVQLGIYPADEQHPGIRYNRVWHDPQGALAFLKKDLQKNVGDSGRPVVVMAHCGFDTDWWHKDDWKALYEAVRPYNVVAYMHGHSGTGLRRYKPEGARGEPLTVINTGQTENGFFVIRITETRLRAAYHSKDAKRYRDTDGVRHYEWDGTWSWRHVLDKDLAPSAPPAAAEGPGPEFIDVFTSGTEGYHTFRIPSVVVTQGGTVLAFCEGRASRADHSQNDIVLKRSTDGGKTWGPLTVIAEDGKNALLNPCAVVVRETGRVLLMYQRYPEGCHTNKTVPGYEGDRVSRSFLIASDDDGRTWSKPGEITRMVKRPTEVTATPVGPGNGIQLRRGKYAGRILMPFVNQIWPRRKVCAAWSDDLGKTWTSGEWAPDGSKGTGAEVALVELADGSVMMNTRSTGGTKRRKVAVSADGGRTWSPLLDEPTLVEPQCQGTILRYSDPLDGQKSRILFANPASRKRRANGTVRLSLDEGKTWPVSRVLYPGGYAYSCLTVLPDRTIGCLFERDGYKHITFARFTLAWLMGQ